MANEPITREEILLNAVATGEQANIKPITREEMFLAKLGGADVSIPTPITRKEQFLNKAIAQGGSGGGNVNLLDLKKTITEYRDDEIIKLPTCAFCGCTNLKMVVLPKVEDVSGQELFEGCPNLAVVDFTALTKLGGYRYDDAANANFPLEQPIVTSVMALVNRGGLFQMGGTNSQHDYMLFDASCGLTISWYKKLYIYVPRAYISEENFRRTEVEDWEIFPDSGVGYQSTYGYDWWDWWEAGRIRAIEDYTVDGTVTGALDFAKMGIDMG